MAVAMTQWSPDPVITTGVESGGCVEALSSPEGDAERYEGKCGHKADGEVDALRLVPWSSLRDEEKNGETISLKDPSEKQNQGGRSLVFFEYGFNTRKV